MLHENFFSVIIIRRYMFLLGYSLVIYQFHQIFVGSILIKVGLVYTESAIVEENTAFRLVAGL